MRTISRDNLVLPKLPLFVAAVIAGCIFAQGDSRASTGSAVSRLGHSVENFTLNDFHGKRYSLADFKDKKVIVLAFLGTECPLAKLYGPRLAALDRKYAPRGVQLLGVNANRQDAVTEIAAAARVAGIGFPMLKDLNNKLADRVGALRTPEVFVLDQARVIRYHGRIDDQYGVGYVKKAASEAYLQTAIDELLAGKRVAKSETGAVGCFIGRVRLPDAAAKVTYSNQVSRILNKRCVSCHRAGEVAPFAMTNYAEVSGWADTIVEVVQNRRMPPWLADPKYGHFSNDQSMPEAEKEILYQWAAAGAPEGDPKELPPPPKFVDGWQLPKDPDKVFYTSDKPYAVPAEGVILYQYFSVDPGFKEDKWIKAIEARPGNRAVVHHIIVYASAKSAVANESARQFLVGSVPGGSAMVLPPGMAKMIPAGDVLVFQVHYTANGSPQTDRSKVGIVFADRKEVTHLVRTSSASDQSFKIPPGADDYRVSADTTPLSFDAELLQLLPHMHLRGKSFRYEARYPGGKSEVLLDVPHYDFGWQLTYHLAERKKLPKGTFIHCSASFDNSENNLSNPDPKATVVPGDQIWDEMCTGLFDVAIPVSQAELEHGKYPEFFKSQEQVARGILEEFDKNHDGKIRQEELPNDPQTRRFFFSLDKNGDASVTLDEIISGVIVRR